MGFENIIEAFYNNKKGRSGRSINQGNSLLNIRESLMDVIGQGREGFDTARLSKLSKKEKKMINTLETKYNRLVSDYASSYKSFLIEHRQLESQVTTCKAKCLEKYNTGVQDYANKRKACTAGCQINGPYIAECKDTYTSMRLQPRSKRCPVITPGKCSGGNITVGQSNYVGRSSTADRKGTTIKDGCCECGGGKGGRPLGNINGNEVKRCDDLAGAFGMQKGSGQAKAYKRICNQAASSSGMETQRTHNFYKKYNVIEAKNAKISDAAQTLYDQIDTLENVNKKLRSSTSDSEMQLARDLKTFEEKYATLMGLAGGKKADGSYEGTDPTIEAQRRSVELKKQAEEMSFYFMSILAIVLIATTIINFRRAI